jgi:cyanophycinase
MKILCAALLAAVSAPAIAGTGTVVAVGGALEDDNAAVYRTLLEAMPGDAPDIVIIPAASGSPAGSARRFANAIARHGGDPSRVRLVQIALIDDPETRDVDESRWANGASDPAEVAKVGRAGLIWFAGGDQARIMAALVAPDGKDTLMLAVIRQRLAQGAVIGGTSAGAAVLGEHMIGCGSPEAALTSPVSRNLADCAATDENALSTPLVLTPGLGFLPGIVIDQHFSQRGRLNRLVRAVACIDADAVTGIGVDEDTGFVFSLASDTGHAVGNGTITLVDPSDGRRSCEGAVMDNVRLARVPATTKD